MNAFKGEGKECSALFSWTDADTAPARLPVYSVKQNDPRGPGKAGGSVSLGGTSEGAFKQVVEECARATRTMPHCRSGEGLGSSLQSKESQVLSAYVSGGKNTMWSFSMYGADVFSDLSALLAPSKAPRLSEPKEHSNTPTSVSLHPEDYSGIHPMESLPTRDDLPSKEEWRLPSLAPRGDIITKRASKSQWVDGTMLLNEYALLKSIGRGTSGKVRLAYSLSRNESVAIKVIARPREGRQVLGSGQRSSSQRIEAVQREIRVMKELRHRNIVSLYEVIDDPETEKLYIVMQYVDEGPIARLDGNGNCDPVRPDELASYARQILAGMEYLQRHGVVHRDIKPENILVSSKKCAFISDFGVAAILGGSDETCLHRFEGTPLFMPPEVFCSISSSSGVSTTADDSDANPNSSYNESGDEAGARKRLLFAMDVWSLGVTFYTLLVGSVPFKTIRDIQNTVQSPLVIPDVVPKSWRSILQSMLTAPPCQRPTIPELRQRVKKMAQCYGLKSPDEVLCLSTSQENRQGRNTPMLTPPCDLPRPTSLLFPSCERELQSRESPATCEHVMEKALATTFTLCDTLISCTSADASATRDE